MPERLFSHFKYRLEQMELFNRMEPIKVDFGESGVDKSGDEDRGLDGSAGQEAADLVEELDL